MASDSADTLRQETWPPINPWHLVVAGLTASVLALFLCLMQSWMPGEGPARVLVPLRGLAIAAGLILAGGAVSLRLRAAASEFEERVVSAALTGLAAFTALLGWLALDREAWDSISLFVGVVAFVGFVGCVLILLPRGARRVVAVVLVVLHFGGILSAITSAPPPGTTPPWITQVLWTYVYRPYVQFTYMNNAYHFYSPEPGPACQLWFYIKFEDGDGEWLKIPKREDYGTRQEYQRILSLTENANYLISEPRADVTWKFGQRVLAGDRYHPRIKPAPWDVTTGDGTPPAFQFREPSVMSKKAIQSFAKHVALTFHSDAHPEVAVQSVKVYRVVHEIRGAQYMAHGLDPDNPTTFVPYYQGEFDREGKMLNPGDPFLYWIIPILYEPKPGKKAPTKPSDLGEWNSDDYDIVDYCALHAEGHSN